MKALSIQQPWAWAILHAGKNIENRQWNTRHRGEFAIHASALGQRYAPLPNGISAPPLNDLPASAIVGVAEVEDVITASDSPWFLGKYGFVLANVRPLAQPIPCKGNLYFWDVPPRVAAAVRRQLDATPPGKGLRHFVAYHNVTKMGGHPREERLLEAWTNKPVKRLSGHVCWLVFGEAPKGKRANTGESQRRAKAAKTREYSLAGVFQVAEAGPATATGFKNHIRGPGLRLRPPLALSGLDWCQDFVKSVGRFGLGLMEIKKPEFIERLQQLALQAGFRAAMFEEKSQ